MLGISEVLRPETFAEALDLLADNPELRPILGGTDLLVQLTDSGEETPLLDLSSIIELKGIRRNGENLWIGAAETHTSVSESRDVAEYAPLLAKSSGIMGSPAIRTARQSVGT